MAAFEDDLRAWIVALRTLTDTPTMAAQFRDVRTQFAVLVAQEAIKVTRADKIPVVYGIWLDAHTEPVYVGQTMDARRRLWDLPIGESHHLANTYPPEVWSRIIVVRWLDILREDPPLQAALIAELQGPGFESAENTSSIGRMLEHRLQRHIRPKFNISKRNSRAGGRRAVDHDGSKSQGAKHSDSVDSLFTRVLDVWRLLAEERPLHSMSVGHRFGGVVFPSSIWQAQFGSPNSSPPYLSD